MKLLFLLALLLPIQSIWAADELAGISARLSKAGITEGRFRQEKTIKVLKKPLISTGAFTYHRKQGVIWQTLTPVSSVVLVNQTHLLTSRGEQNLPPAFGRVFLAMFGGNVQLLKESFEIAAENLMDGAWRLRLKPKDALLQQLITEIQLIGDMDLRQIDIRETNGNFTRITFERLTHPETLTPAQEADFARLSSPR